MNFVEHVIIGGGISGCLMAHHLSQRKLDFKLIEAQAILGGRIQSTEQGLDLGPTWFWPHQSSVKVLFESLNVSFFNQYSHGDYVYQTAPNAPISQGKDHQSMLSHRTVGGMATIINALKKGITKNSIGEDNIVLNSPATRVSKQENLWYIELNNGKTLTCQTLWLAMPPRQVVSLFTSATPEQPLLSSALISHLQAQQTWMSAQAKFVAVYKTAFWREAGLSGQGFSRVGPMVEINDASGVNADANSDVNSGANTDSPAALFGFIGVPASHRQSINKQQMIDACVAQLGKLFGEAALSPVSTHYIDWANNEFIATTADIEEPSQHAHFDQARFKAELSRLNLGLIGSEFSQTEPGYIAGAIEHVNQQAAALD